MVKTITVKKVRDLYNKEGHFFNFTKKFKLINFNCDIKSEDGTLLVCFRKKVIPKACYKLAYDNLIGSSIKSSNRGASAGPLNPKSFGPSRSKRIERHNESVFRGRVRLNNGNLSNTTVSNPVYSGIVGYMDGSARLPCRLTRYTRDNFDKYKKAIPYIEHINKQFEKTTPNKYKAQLKKAKKTKTQIGKTAYSTITVNKNFRTGLHKDKGDDPEGFGNLTVVSKGKYKGGYTMFPEYYIAVDVQPGDYLGMNVHEYHCNSKITGKGTRMSCVCYYRTKLHKCPKGMFKKLLKDIREYTKEKLKNKNSTKAKSLRKKLAII